VGREPAVAERFDHAAAAPADLEGAEDIGDGRLDLLVGIHADLTVEVVDVSDRQRQAQLAATGGRLLRLLHTLAQDVQLDRGHRAFEPQQELVVEVAQVVDTIGVGDEGVGHLAELQQPLEVGGVPRQP
jgi:hypothetical protein